MQESEDNISGFQKVSFLAPLNVNFQIAMVFFQMKLLIRKQGGLLGQGSQLNPPEDPNYRHHKSSLQKKSLSKNLRLTSRSRF